MSLAWGGQSNGRVATTLLKPAVNFAPLYPGEVNAGMGSNLLRADAADQWSSLALEFATVFNKPLNGSEFYRIYARQNLLYQLWLQKKGNLAAYPGTSNHGWGRSVDIGSNVGTWSSAEHKWVAAQGAKRGFHFTVASEGWHVDFLADATLAPIANADGHLGGINGDTTMSKTHVMRNKKTGDITVINVEAGFWWHIPADGYVGAWNTWADTSTEDVDDNWFGYWKQMADYQLQRQADAVWNTQAKGFNGVTTFGNRVLGIDENKENVATISPAAVASITSALPAQAGGAIAVDYQSLSKALAPLLAAEISPGVAQELGKRISNG